MNLLPNPENDDARAAEDRRLEALLRDAAPDYIDDAGFTAGVLGRLPASRAVRHRRRLWLVGGAGVLGVAAAALLAGPAMVEQGSAALGWLAVYGQRPVPYVGDALSLALLVVGCACAALGWRWSARAG